MGSTPRRIKNIPARKRSESSHYRRSRPHHKKPTITMTSSVSDKLEALKNLIPTQEIDGAGATSSTDKLFKETADYILLLRTQVSILQKLVDFYGTSSSSSSSLVQHYGSLELVFQLSSILDTGLDPHTLSVLIALCDLGLNPEALAAVVKELRREPPLTYSTPSSS